MEVRGAFGLTGSDVILEIFGDDGKASVAYLGANPTENNEMMFQLKSKSTTDKKSIMVAIDENGGRFQSRNKMGEGVVLIAVGSDGGGVVDLRDKFGYIKKVLRWM